MGDTSQLSFRDSTNEDCDLLLSTGTVHWEWFYGWHAAFAHYFPKYLQTSDSCIRAFFATNVPYNFPTDVVWGDFYQALEDKLFVFRPREWRGNNDAGAPPFSGQNYLRFFNIHYENEKIFRLKVHIQVHLLSVLVLKKQAPPGHGSD